MKKIKTKLLAIVFLINILIQFMSPIFALSGSGSARWSGGQYDSGMKPTEYSNLGTGVLIRRLVNLDTNERITVFCTQNLVDFRSGVVQNGNYYIPTDPKIKKACKIAYVGWYSKHKDYVVDGYILDKAMVSTKKDYVFTQVYIWEVLGQSDGVFIDNATQTEYVAFKNKINEKIDNIQKRPSFDASTVNIDAGATNVITDTNGVLKDYNSIDKSLSEGIRITHNKGENTLTITVDKNCTTENYRLSDATLKSWGLIKDETKETDTTIYFNFPDGVQNQLYAMSYNDPVTMSFSMKINLTGNLQLSKLNTNGDLVDGAVFTVKGPGYNGDVTVQNGKITLEKIQRGTYTVKEKSVPNGYLLNVNTYTVEVISKETTQQAIIDEEPTGDLSLIKTDIKTGNSNRVDGTSHHGDATLNGAVYTLYAKNDIYNKKETIKYFSKDEAIANYIFNEYGVASVKIINNSTPANINVNGNKLSGLPMGEYYAKETTVPTGYTQDAKIYDEIFNYKDSNTKVIEVLDTVKNEVQKAPFEVIKVTTNNNSIAEYVSNAEFTAILTKYVQFYGSFDEALKHLDEYASDEYSIFRTGSNGHGVSGLLAYGNYMVRETYTPSDVIETVEDFYVQIDKDSKIPVKEMVANDLPFESYLKLQKLDKKTGKFVTYSNATFSLYKQNDNKQWERVQCKVGDKYYDSWTTNNQGIVKTETKLPAGKYKIDEIKIPTGFIQLDEELIFEINKKNNTLNYDKDLDAWIIVSVENEKPTGTLKINKIVDLRQDIDKTLIDNIDYTKISFELVTDEKIIDYADGSTIYEKGAVVGQYNLNADGTLTITDLPMGKYHLKELTTIDGAVLDGTEHKVVFTQTDTKTKEYVIELNIENKTTEIKISKQDITGEKELVGAKLTILNENNEVIDSWTSTQDAHIIEGLKVGETYILREEIAPDGYVKATEIKFKVQNSSEIQIIKMIDKVVEMSKKDIGGKEINGAELKVLNKDGEVVDSWVSTEESHRIKGLIEGETYTLIENYAPDGYVVSNSIEFTVTSDKETQKINMIDKRVSVKKTDLVTDKELEGAELEVTDKDGNIIDSWISGKEEHYVKGLIEGEIYTLTEKTCPYGYEIAESIKFTVNENKETQLIEMKDMPILKNIRILKVDATTKNIIKDSFSFAIYKDFKCTNLIKEVNSNKSNGTVTFEDLRYGTYYIKENKAPKDYQLSNKIVKVEINEKGIFVDGTQMNEKNDTIEFLFENEKIDIPDTSDNFNIRLILFIIGLTLVGIIFIIIRNKKNKKD